MKILCLRIFLFAFLAIASPAVPLYAAQGQPLMDIFFLPDSLPKSLQFRVELDRFSLRQGLNISLNTFLNIFKSGPEYYVEFSSPYCLVNGVNLGAVRAQLVFRQYEIVISYFNSPSISIKGVVKKDTFNIDISVKGIDIEKVRKLFGFVSSTVIEGSARGSIYLSGNSTDMFVKGSISIFDGVLADMLFKKSVMNFEGYYPYLRVFNSYVQDYSGGTFSMEGYVNFNNVSGEDLDKIKFPLEHSLDLGSEKGKWVSWGVLPDKRSDLEGVTFRFDLDKNKTFSLKIKPNFDSRYFGKGINF